MMMMMMMMMMVVNSNNNNNSEKKSSNCDYMIVSVVVLKLINRTIYDANTNTYDL